MNPLKATIVGLALLGLTGLASATAITSTSFGSPVVTSGFGPNPAFNSSGARAFWTIWSVLMQSPNSGWLGVLSIDGPGKVSYTYLGKEAGDTNRFVDNGGTINPLLDSASFGATSYQNYLSAGQLDFGFQTTAPSNQVGSVYNGHNSATSNPNFAIFNGGSSGYQYFLAYNDRGRDHDWDDMLIGVKVSTVSVPEPSTLALLGIGLAGLGFARRKKT